jgi:2-methylcitrate dehydratase PrpD
MSSEETVAQKLGMFVSRLKYEDLPTDVVRRAKELLLDQLGCQLLGSTVEWNQPVYKFVKENKSGGPASIVNYGDKVAVDDAVFVNGTFGQGCELDDHYDRGGGHPGAASVPVAMTLGELKAVDGKTFLAAIAAGYEIGWRAVLGLLPQMHRRGFHSQSTIGVFIAAATAGKILRLDPNQMATTLAIAGSHACGTMEFDQSGGEVKRMHAGLACSGGVRSAMLSALGLTGPPTIFEGKRGVLRGFGGECNPAPMTRDLGSEFAVMHAAIKSFPVIAGQHSPIQLLSKLTEENGIRPGEVQKIEVGVNEILLMHVDAIYEPKQVIEAQVSLRFSLALRLLKRSNDLRLYMDRKLWQEPEILEVGEKIHLFADPQAKDGEQKFLCNMRICLSDGRVIEGSVPYHKGTPRNPLSKDEIQKKFLRLAEGILPNETLHRIIDKVEEIDREDDISSLVRLMTSAKSEC